MPWSKVCLEMNALRPYSQDLRERVMAACQEGKLSPEAIARQFKVSSRWIRQLLERQRRTGSFAALPAGGGRPPLITPRHEAHLSQAVAKRPDATLEQLRQACGNLPVSLAAICKRLQKLKLPRKKKDAPRQ